MFEEHFSSIMRKKPAFWVSDQVRHLNQLVLCGATCSHLKPLLSFNLSCHFGGILYSKVQQCLVIPLSFSWLHICEVLLNHMSWLISDLVSLEENVNLQSLSNPNQLSHIHFL